MVKLERIPQLVMMNTVALRAVSIALRAGKVLASCASRPLSSRAEEAIAEGAGASGPRDVRCAAGRAGAVGAAPAGVRPRISPQTRTTLTIAVRVIAPQPDPAPGGAWCIRSRGRFASRACCSANLAK